jgi:hypothetical protein
MSKVACGFYDFIDELMHGEFPDVIKSECMSISNRDKMKR